jgi:predicted transcriptional regulator
MSDALVLKSAIDLMDSATIITWSNKYICPAGYNYNEDGYVITNRPFPLVRACIGMSFWFLIKLLGLKEYIRQNVIALRLLNPEVHRAILSSALWGAFKRSGLTLDRNVYDEIVREVFTLTELPALNSNIYTWRETWFSSTCEYDTVSKVIKQSNSIRIDADRELMDIDKKYITKDVADFTGFSHYRVDRYWSEKKWPKKLRTLYTLDEAVEELAKKGITDPSRKELSEVSGLSTGTISRSMIEIKKMIEATRLLQISNNVNKEICETTKI